MKITEQLILLCAAVGALAGAMMPAGSASGGAPAARPAARPTMQPIPSATPAQPVSMPGAYIQLRADEAGMTPGMRAVVQWQGGDGRWYDVDGWRSVIGDRPVTWWVAPKDFGTGPFRWAGYSAGSTEPVRTSTAFMLPKSDGALSVIVWRK